MLCVRVLHRYKKRYTEMLVHGLPSAEKITSPIAVKAARAKLTAEAATTLSLLEDELPISTYAHLLSPSPTSSSLLPPSFSHSFLLTSLPPCPSASAGSAGAE